MRAPDAADLFALAWRLTGRLPRAAVRGGFSLGADVAWLRRGAGIRRLEANLARVRPGLGPRSLRRLSRSGMRSYMRYYAEAFTLRSVTPEQLSARVRLAGEERLLEHRDAGRSVVAALGHLGNWDLAGAYATQHLMPVVTVAERLKPEALYEEFLQFRQDLGMTILTLGDSGVFTGLLRAARAGGSLVCLLADRDLTQHGVEVDMFGERARVAAGPAALAVATGVPLLPIGLFYERLHGARRRAAGTPWGIVVQFLPAVQVRADLPRQERIGAYTQGWVDALARFIADHPQDWHMLQRVFVADLDPERYARTLRQAGEESE
ncbi:MAG: phosphatidylinositol mannoside acyltransferase [Cellulomonadaceae bacterium]